MHGVGPGHLTAMRQRQVRLGARLTTQIRPKQPTSGTASAKQQLAIIKADVGIARGEKSLILGWCWPMSSIHLKPIHTAIGGANQQETAIYRVTDCIAVQAIGKGHAVEEHIGVGIVVDLAPRAAAIYGSHEMSGRSDTQKQCGLLIHHRNGAELRECTIDIDRIDLPCPATIGSATEDATVGSEPDHRIAHNFQSPDADAFQGFKVLDRLGYGPRE